MSGIETRLRSHLREQARALEPSDQGVEYVMSEGRRKRNGRLMLIGVASAAALTGLVAGSVALLNHKDPDTISPAIEPLRLGLPNAAAGAPNFTWEVLSSESSSSMLGNASWSASMSSNGLSRYTFGTVPVPFGQPRQQSLYATGDGIDPFPVGAPFDPWISDLDSSDGSVYAIGTVPEGTSYAFQVGITNDAATWSNTTLPLDLETVRSELGIVTTTGAQVVAGNGVAVAVVQTIASEDNLVLGAAVQDLETPFGFRIGADGVEVYGEPNDLAAIAARECPPGWALKEGEPRQTGASGAGPGAVATTIQFFPGNGSANSWHCESPDENSPDLWLDPSRVHGDVVQVVPFAELGLSDASVKALRRSVRVFTSTNGGEWTEQATPAGGSSNGQPTLLWTGSRFALRAAGVDGAQLWLSDDGANWHQATLPDATDLLAVGALPDGSLLLAGRQAGELVAYTSPDGSTWKGVLLQPLLQLKDTWRVTQMQLVTGPNGASLLLQTSQDGVATLGAPVIEHGRYSLRITDAQGVAELLQDGRVLDRLDSVWLGTAANSVNGTMSVGQDGNVLVIDPATGERVDGFTSTEIQQALDVLWTSEEGQRIQSVPPPDDWWVLDTVDGATWGLTPLDLGGSNIWLGSLGAATPGGHAFRFSINGGTGVVLGRPS